MWLSRLSFEGNLRASGLPNDFVLLLTVKMEAAKPEYVLCAICVVLRSFWH